MTIDTTADLSPPNSTARRDRANIISQILIKAISVPYGLIVVALAARYLPADESYLFLQAASLMTLPGLLQLGMGYLILREVSNAWAREGRLPDLPIVRTGFLVIFAVTTLAASIAVMSTLNGGLVPALLPIVIISLFGQWSIVADYVRLGKGEVLKTNLLLLGGNIVCACLVWWAVTQPHPSLAVMIFGGLAAPFIASLASFALLARDPAFRSLISVSGKRAVAPLVRQAVPMFLNTVGFSLMLVIPIGASVIPWYPEISFPALACLRLTASVIYLYYFALQPIGPIFLRAWYGTTSTDFLRTSLKLMGALAGLCVLAGIGFALTAPMFVDVWLSGVTVTPVLAAQWGTIMTLALITMTTVYFCQNTSRPVVAAVCLIVTDVVMAIAPLAGLSIEASMIAALGIGSLIGSSALARAIAERARAMSSGDVAENR